MGSDGVVEVIFASPLFAFSFRVCVCVCVCVCVKWLGVRRWWSGVLGPLCVLIGSSLEGVGVSVGVGVGVGVGMWVWECIAVF